MVRGFRGEEKEEKSKMEYDGVTRGRRRKKMIMNIRGKDMDLEQKKEE